MYRPYDRPGPEPIGFLLIPKFSAMAFFSAIEPLRVANRLAGRAIFSWQVFSEDGEPVEASSGMRLIVDGAIDAAAGLPTVIVCAGFDPVAAETRHMLASLRRLARAGTMLGALDTGAHLLAKAGLADQVTVTMHWEAVPGFREDFPDIAVSDELFEVQGQIFTCAGGTAALDMMLDMIGRKHGGALAVAVSEQFIHDRIRSRHDHQRMALSRRLGVSNGKLLKIVALMEDHLEAPLALEHLAESVGISLRQLERLFRTQLDAAPAGFYRGLRLDRARHLLRQTDLSVTEIAMATGFSSASTLSRRYHEQFGCPPSADRADPSGVALTPESPPAC
jgi:AraC family carnitine catabolism transcriptional activator